MTTPELIQRLRDHSSGAYRPAADRLERMDRALEEGSAMVSRYAYFNTPTNHD